MEGNVKVVFNGATWPMSAVIVGNKIIPPSPLIVDISLQKTLPHFALFALLQLSKVLEAN